MKHALFFYEDDDGGSGGGGGDDAAPPDDGSQTVVVGSDDSILSIAKANGFWWSTVWNHPHNADLKTLRKTPEVLQEGDKVYVPKPEPKKESKPNEARHKFKLKGEQAKFKIRLMRMDEARANEDYTLVIDGTIKTGKTDGNGMIETDIPNDAKGGVLKLQGGKEEYPITIGRLGPGGLARRRAATAFQPGLHPRIRLVAGSRDAQGHAQGIPGKIQTRRQRRFRRADQGKIAGTPPGLTPPPKGYTHGNVRHHQQRGHRRRCAAGYREQPARGQHGRARRRGGQTRHAGLVEGVQPRCRQERH